MTHSPRADCLRSRNGRGAVVRCARCRSSSSSPFRIPVVECPPYGSGPRRTVQLPGATRGRRPFPARHRPGALQRAAARRVLEQHVFPDLRAASALLRSWHAGIASAPLPSQACSLLVGATWILAKGQALTVTVFDDKFAHAISAFNGALHDGCTTPRQFIRQVCQLSYVDVRIIPDRAALPNPVDQPGILIEEDLYLAPPQHHENGRLTEETSVLETEDIAVLRGRSYDVGHAELRRDAQEGRTLTDVWDRLHRGSPILDSSVTWQRWVLRLTSSRRG